LPFATRLPGAAAVRKLLRASARIQ
jgi:hypothetical protein